MCGVKIISDGAGKLKKISKELKRIKTV